MSNRTRLFIGAMAAIYAAARIWRLSDACLWFDEIFSVHAAEHSWSSLFWFVAQDLIHPPLFYMLLKTWIGIGGDGVLWLRLFPFLFSVLSIAPFLYLCRELRLSGSTTVTALALFAMNGALIKYAQEVRMYAPLLFFSLVSLWLFARFFFRGKNIWVLTFVNILLIYTHYFGWFFVVAEMLTIFIFQRVKIRHVLVMTGINLIAFLPWLIAIFRAAFSGSDIAENIGWISAPGFRAVFTFVFDLVEPFYFQQSSADPSTIIWVSLPILAAVVTAKLWYLFTERRDEDRRILYLLSIFLALPILLALVISLLAPYSIWGSRHLIIVFAPASILSAIFLNGIEIRNVRIAIIGLIAVLSLSALVRSAVYEPPSQIWCAWDPLAAQLPTGERQIVYTFEDLTAYHVWFSTRGRGDVDLYKVNGVEGIVEDKAYFIPRGFDDVTRIDPNGISGDRIWLMFRDQRLDERHPPLVGLLGAGYSIGERREMRTDSGMAFLIELKK